MAASKKLPDCEVLTGHFEAGMSNPEIGALYGVTAEGVRQALVKCGVRREHIRPDHSHYLPWRIRADHVGDVIARRLRAYSKRQQGRPLTASEERLLDAWLVFMDGGNSQQLPLSVHYDRTDSVGFWLEARKPGDRDYISPP